MFDPRRFTENHGNSVEAVFHRTDSEDSPVNPCRSTDLTLFPEIDRRKRRRKIFGASRFDLDEAENFAVESDDVDFPRDRRAAHVAADGNSEIATNDAIAASYQEIHGKSFAVIPQ